MHIYRKCFALITLLFLYKGIILSSLLSIPSIPSITNKMIKFHIWARETHGILLETQNLYTLIKKSKSDQRQNIIDKLKELKDGLDLQISKQQKVKEY